MPHNHPGYDIRSTTTESGETLFLEVKGRIEGADTFVVTQNELRFAANVPDAYVLALVEVSPHGPEARPGPLPDAAVWRRCPPAV